MACSICWCSRTTSARACRKRRYCSERQRMRSRWSTPSERMRVRPASLQESTMESAVRHSAVTTRVAATRLDLVDRAFDQFADLENLPQLAAILGRQVAKDLSLAGGDIGNRHGCTHGLWPITASRKANSVTMHFYGTRILFECPAKNAASR